MYDKERIGRLITDIERYLHDLANLSITSSQDLSDRRNFYALSMILFSLLTALIDCADEVVIARNLGMPATYREIFSLLHRDGFIDRETFEQMSLLVSYRNRPAHEYGEITPDDLLHVLSKVSTMTGFVNRVKALVAD